MPGAPVETIADALRPLTERPEEAAVLWRIDGTLAPIVERAEEATVPEGTSRLLGRIARRYRVVACISGRGAAGARRIVGGGGGGGGGGAADRRRRRDRVCGRARRGAAAARPGSGRARAGVRHLGRPGARLRPR